MRTWQTFNIVKKCGMCPTLIRAGRPVQVIHVNGFVKYRCQVCADESAESVATASPPALDKDARVEQVTADTMLRLTGAAQGALDLIGKGAK